MPQNDENEYGQNGGWTSSEGGNNLDSTTSGSVSPIASPLTPSTNANNQPPTYQELQGFYNQLNSDYEFLAQQVETLQQALQAAQQTNDALQYKNAELSNDADQYKEERDIALTENQRLKALLLANGINPNPQYTAVSYTVNHTNGQSHTNKTNQGPHKR